MERCTRYGTAILYSGGLSPSYSWTQGLRRRSLWLLIKDVTITTSHPKRGQKKLGVTRKDALFRHDWGVFVLIEGWEHGSRIIYAGFALFLWCRVGGRSCSNSLAPIVPSNMAVRRITYPEILEDPKSRSPNSGLQHS